MTPEMAIHLVFGRPTRNLTGTRLDLVDTGPVMSAEEAASSCQRYVAATMATCTARHFDQNLNHRNNDGRSVLKTIAGLDDRCRDTKRALMRAVVGVLDRERTTLHAAAVARLIPSLGDVLFQDPEYLRGHEDFVKWLCAGLLGNGSTLLDPRLGDAALGALGGHVARLLETKDIEIIAGHSVGIYQVLREMRRRAASASSPEVGAKWMTESRTLHEQYREVLKKKLPSLMDESGVYESERAVWPDDDDGFPDAFPLISADGRSCVVMTDSHYRQLVLGDRSRAPVEGNRIWGEVRCVEAGADETFPASVTGSDDGGTRGTATVPILERFPLLSAARRREDAALAQGRMLELAGLTGTWLERFKAALQESHISDPREKMTEAADQDELFKIFETKYEDPLVQGVRLRPEHLAALREQWRADTDEAFAFRLLCMAAVYTNYSSSHVFGTETESPNALRTYAMALLRETHEADPRLLPNDQLASWVGKLKGEGNAFQCTAVLYSIQSKHLNTRLRQEAGNGPLHQVRNDMIPLAWREESGIAGPPDADLQGANLQLAQVQHFA
jgi:hypothetical protein